MQNLYGDLVDREKLYLEKLCSLLQNLDLTTS